jgi:group I intron endonuclease
MRILKSHPLLRLANHYLIDASQPSNISYLWNFGSLLAVCLGIQIITGVTLAMHYNPNVLEAFNSIEHIMRDVNNGWLIRYLHSNTASAFFFLVYLHIGRGLYYGSYRAPRSLTWIIGTIILILMMAIGFLGFFNIAQNDNNTKKIQPHLQASIFPSTINLKNLYLSLEKLFCWLLLLLLILISLSLSEEDSPQSSKGNWENLKPLVTDEDLKKEESIIRPKRIFVISDRRENRGSLIPSGANPTDLLVLKALAKRYPFYPEHYEQMENANKQLNNETWWLQQQDNTLDRPSEEKKKSYHLAKGEKEYPNVPGRRHYSTSTRSNLNIENGACASCASNIKEFINSKGLKPVYIYDNLEEDTVRKQISKELKGLSGIYLILNKEVLKYYIGSASTGKFNSRFTNHLIYFNGSKVLKSAVAKYKLKSFCFMVLELFPETVNQENNKELLKIEDFYLKTLLPDYNIMPEASSSFGYKHTEETRLKMKANYSEDRRRKIGDLNRGKKFSPEQIEIIRQAALNRVKPVYYIQSIENMKKKSKPVLVRHLDGSLYKEFASITDAAKELDCSIKTIYRSLRSIDKTLKKRWFVEEKKL